MDGNYFMCINIDKLNDCLMIGLSDNKAQNIINQSFDQIADFTNNHMTDKAGMLLKEMNKSLDREEIINLFLEDMYNQISRLL